MGKKIKKGDKLRWWILAAAILLLCITVGLLVVFQPDRFSSPAGRVLSQGEVSSSREFSAVVSEEASQLLVVPLQSSAVSELESTVEEPESSPQPEENAVVGTGVLISNFPIVYQMPQLPTGCEITALTMVLQYYGLDADKEEMATDYLPTSPSTNRYTGSDGRVYGIDLDAYFVGSPFDDSGIICGPQAIVTAANQYLEDQGSSLQAVDRTGATPEELYALVDQDIQVVVWVTIGMTPRQEARSGWYTESGKYVDWTTNDHCAVLVGYTDTTVWIADPLAGLVEYDRDAFEEVFASRDNRCVVLR